MNVCGIDVSSKKLDVVIIKNNKPLKSKEFGNDQKGHDAVSSYLLKNNIKRIGIEATGYYHLDIAMKLQENNNFNVMVINPRAIHNFTKALMIDNKSDSIDAKIIATFIQRMDFIAWTPPKKESFELRACGRYLIGLVKQKTQAKNKLHAYSATKNMSKIIIADLEETIEWLEAKIKGIEKHVLALIKENQTLAQQYQLLTDMTGVGVKTAVKILGEVGVLSTDMKGKQWVAHAGLHPRVMQSGSSLNKSIGIGKNGNPYIREALYMAALSASRHDPYIKGYYQHLINDNGLKKIQALCAVMRKMLLAMHGVLKNNKPFDNKRFYCLPT